MTEIQSSDADDHTTDLDLLWICPHCDGQPLELLAACIHIAAAHDRCPSCSVEHLVLRHLIAGHGEVVLSWAGL